MKAKKYAGMLVTAAMITAISTTALAAGWQQNATGWWYGTNADNSQWYSNGWQWIDGNGDGTAECYYFDQNGYMLANTTTPDGFQVDQNGAWIVNGSVQVQSALSGTEIMNEGKTADGFPRLDGLYLDTTWKDYYFVHTAEDGTLQLYFRREDGSEGELYLKMAYLGDGKWSDGDGSILNTNAWITDGANFHLSMGGYMQRTMVKQ